MQQWLSFVSIPLPDVPVGSRLRYFFSEWSQITSDPFVLNMITGMEIDLWELPKQTHPPSPLHFNQEETATTDKLIQELLSKMQSLHVKEKGDFVSTIFLCRKPNSSYRMILNLKNFNKYVDYCKYKMDTLIKILALVMQEVYMCSLDLTDAYLSVLISMLFSHFLKFKWKGQLFKFMTMPFGLTEAPRKFTKLLKPPLSVIRHAGFTISAYLDDFFQCEKMKDYCRQAICFAYNLLVSLGFLPNDSKLVYKPENAGISPTLQNPVYCFIISSGKQ